ncbi:MAG: hypothetical protein Q9224_001621 [Gallowayella concinna]
MTISRMLPLFVLALIIAFTTATATLNLPFSDTAHILCYDPRYASHKPDPDDCAQVLSREIGMSPVISRPRTFSRRPTGSQQQLPFTWKTEQDRCRVIIDIPELPKQRAGTAAQASMLDIKRAAFGVLLECVLKGDRLGGLVQTGKESKLQLRLEAGENSSRLSREDTA